MAGCKSRTGRRGVLAVCLNLSVSAVVSAADRDTRWIEVRGPHFTVYSNGDLKHAVQVVSQFESIRDLFRRLWPRARLDPSRPIVILAAKDESSLRALMPEFWERKGGVRPSGLFVRAEDKHYIALRTDLADEFEAWEENPYHVVYHEYAHLLLDLNFGRLPAWVNEGLAEFYGATIIGREESERGKPLRSHIYLLRERAHLPLERLLKVDYGSPEYQEESRATVFYAQSWALVHYFLLGDKGAHSQAFVNYIDLLRKEVADDDAARQAFGDLRRLAQDLDRYVRRFAFVYVRTKLANDGAPLPVESRPVPEAEWQAVHGDFHLARGQLQAARPLLERAAELAPDLAAAQASLGRLELREERQEEARRRVARAVELASTSYLTHYLHAILNMGSWETRESLAVAEQSLRRSVALNSDFAPGYALLAEVAAFRSGDNKTALGLARRAVSLEPGVIGHRLTVGRLLAGMGQLEEARVEGTRALAAARSDHDRHAAQDFLDSLSRVGPKTPAATALASDAVDRSVAARGVLVKMSCPPTGELIFVVETASGPLTLRAAAADQVFLRKGGSLVQLDWQCGALRVPVTVRYLPHESTTAEAGIDGAVMIFDLDAGPEPR
jgi:tetratricopeptide (TPR) repeat protein